MSEKKPGFNPEVPSPEIKALDAEQMAEVEKYAARLYESYFTGVKTKADAEKHFNQMSALLDRGFNFLTGPEKQGIKDNVSEKLKLLFVEAAEPQLEQPVSSPTPEAQDATVEEPQEEFHFDAESFFEHIKQKSGCTMENSKLLDKLIGDIKQTRRMVIDRDIKFSDFYEEEATTSSGTQKKYTFYCNVKVGRGKLDSVMKVEMTLMPILKGLPGKQTRELVPKFFLMPVKK